ncbi:Nramp family divalent metal transporter [Agrobacterium rosae]|uniref:Iron transporter n=1 Tax=Agrobacterium rosae TaxID=1972867 RepID=A0AAE5RXM7_9HYPH|nr:Nramp family divalent metal transporter [Agrobacterium rosae]KAA3514528.1 divalent metal cation transporter [Agrobacterium rosae]KAA3523191.1 divalent metal cation transporter [Agrobacterium rosae]MCM2433476.1 Nramp family divalent metal transporter [Agrobacterium rosae]MDX8329972.1 Nramp family divalent metal transporter [Agrobacterium rosae]MQB47932.1 divalent metal cation transporter [Agrobacterium rosae]
MTDSAAIAQPTTGDDKAIPPATGRWKLIGPGIVAAATGVGAGDLVATLIAGSRFGYALLWAAVLGCIVKIALAEGSARYHLATGSTMLEGWRSLGKWTSWYFGIYIMVWGFVYGATAMSATALPLAVFFPSVPLWIWAVLTGLSCAAFVAFNRYDAFETVMKIFIGIMFVIVIGIAIMVSPNVGEAVTGLIPSVPEGSAIYTLGLIGGVGGTITMASYGYWVNAKGWRTPAWMGVMRLDNRVAYIVTGMFVVAMLIIGAELLYASQIALSTGDRGLLDLDRVLEERFGSTMSTLFLIGFFATAISSVLGVWQGVSMLFADFVRGIKGETGSREGLEKTPAFRFYLFWLTIPPMVLLFLGRPFLLVIIYGALGAFFMPFLALTLIWLLNSSRVPKEWRSGWLSNGLLGISALLFIVLCISEVIGLFTR